MDCWLYPSSEVEIELTDQCTKVTEGIEEEAVTELDAVDVPGIVCS